eukprot:comp17020_c0_seq1/m.15707 comp17020_c0_seq1/g.15707  ORF comp17020_c0_seq1/g.15707 comp17020_c0_seq1/m.15707 type:complete len:304 (-) comp17020_c0_seq1:151-1062(-)
MGDHKREDLVVNFKYLLAGGIAGAVSRTLVSPLERTKILFQINNGGQKLSVWRTLVGVYRKEGWVGFFRGNGTNVVRMVPYSAIQFAAYENFKQLLLREGEQDLDTIRRLAAGAMAGITSVAATYPLDLVRTRLSIQQETPGNVKYTGIFHCLRTILKEEGGFFSGCLYRGIVPTVMGIAPYVALNFTVYETLKIYAPVIFPDHIINGELSVPYRLGCGATAGAIAQTFTYPLDLVRRRFQMKSMPGSPFKYKSTFDAFITIVRTEGVGALYKGLLPNYLKVVPSISVSFVTYEMCKRFLLDL